jgi:hypothetical protein
MAYRLDALPVETAIPLLPWLNAIADNESRNCLTDSIE